MSLAPPTLHEKYCFVYCGPYRCNCKRGHNPSKYGKLDEEFEELLEKLNKKEERQKIALRKVP